MTLDSRLRGNDGRDTRHEVRSVSSGVISDDRFTTAEIKTPLQNAALANGWRWQGVTFGKL